MLLPFKLGGGGPIGNGATFLDFMNDHIAAIQHLMMTPNVKAPSISHHQIQ